MAAKEGGKEYYEITVKLDELNKSVQEAVSKINSIGNSAVKEGDRIDAAFKKVGAAVGAYFTFQQVQQFASSIVKVRKEIQSLEISFRTLLGSEEKATKLLGEIKTFAVSTPMQMKDLASGAQTMLGFGIEADKVMTYLKQLGDISMGDSQKFQSLTLAFSQATAAGKLQGQDLLQLINAGFNPLNEIAKKTGKTIGQLKDDMSKGAIGADQLADALASATGKGGQFHNMLKNQSKSIEGALSNLQGAWDDMLNSIGEKGEGVFTDTINGVTEVVKNYEKYIDVIVGLSAAYGTYKTVLMATNVLQSQNGIAQAIKLIMTMRVQLGLLTAKQAAFNLVCSANPYVLLASAIAGVAGTLTYFYVTSDKTTESQKQMNKASKEAREEYDKEKKSVDELISVVRDETKSETERQMALEKLKNTETKYLGNIGNVFKKYKTYADAVKDLTNALKEMNGVMENKSDQDLMSDYKEDVKTLSKLREYKKLKGNVDNSYGNAKLRAEQKLAPAYSSLPQNVQNSLKKGDNIDDIIEAYEKRANSERKAIGEKLSAKNTVKEESSQTNQNKNYWEEKKKTAEAALAELDSSKEGTKEWLELEKQILQYQKEIDKYNTGKNNNQDQKDSKEAAKLAKETADYNREQERAKIERMRMVEDLEDTVAQAQIDAMEEGEAKIQSQRAFNNAKEIADIKRQREDYLQQKKDAAKAAFDAEPANKEKNSIFDDSAITLSEEEEKAFELLLEATRKKQLNELDALKREASNTMNQFLADFGSYAQKISAIEALYKERISNATTEGERQSLTAQMNGEKQSVRNDYAQQVAEMTPQQQKRQLEMLQGVMNANSSKATGADGNFDTESLQAFQQQIAELKNQIDANNPFKALAEGKDELKAALEEVKAAETEYVNAQNEELLAQKQLNAVNSTTVDTPEKTRQREAAEKALATAKARTAKASQNLNKAQTKEVNASKKVSKAEKKITSDVQKLGGEITNLGDVIGGSVGSIISLMGNITSVVSGAIDGVKAMAKTGEESISAVEKASVILAIISAAFQLAQKIANLFNNDDDLQEEIEANERKIKELERTYSDLERQVNKTYSKQKAANIESEIELLKQKRLLIEENMRLEDEKKNTDDDKLEDYKDQIHEIEQQIEDLKDATIDALFGEDVNSAIDKFAEAWVEAWESGESRVKSARDTVKDMMKAMVTESIKAFIQSNDKMQAIRAKMAEYWADEIFSDEERAIIEEMADNLDRELEDKYGWANDLITGNSESGEGTGGGFATASQESIDELNGRFLSIQMDTSVITEAMVAVQESLRVQTNHLEAVRVNTEQSVNIGLEQINYLSNIDKTTKQMNERLEQIELNTRNI